MIWTRVRYRVLMTVPSHWGFPNKVPGDSTFVAEVQASVNLHPLVFVLALQLAQPRVSISLETLVMRSVRLIPHTRLAALLCTTSTFTVEAGTADYYSVEAYSSTCLTSWLYATFCRMDPKVEITLVAVSAMRLLHLMLESNLMELLDLQCSRDVNKVQPEDNF